MRPIVETGFENMLLVRLILERLRESGSVDTAQLMADWSPSFRDSLIERFQSTKVCKLIVVTAVSDA
jgi:superfamily II DNA or RNA helicase